MWKHAQLIRVSTSTHLNRPLWYIKGTWSWVSHQKTFCSFQGEMVHDLTTIWEPTRAGGTVSRRGRKIVLWRGYGGMMGWEEARWQTNWPDPSAVQGQNKLYLLWGNHVRACSGRFQVFSVHPACPSPWGQRETHVRRRGCYQGKLIFRNVRLNMWFCNLCQLHNCCKIPFTSTNLTFQSQKINNLAIIKIFHYNNENPTTPRV